MKLAGHFYLTKLQEKVTSYHEIFVISSKSVWIFQCWYLSRKKCSKITVTRLQKSRASGCPGD